MDLGCRSPIGRLWEVVFRPATCPEQVPEAQLDYIRSPTILWRVNSEEYDIFRTFALRL